MEYLLILVAGLVVGFFAGRAYERDGISFLR